MSPEAGDFLQDMGFWTTQSDAVNSWGYDLEPATITRHTSKNAYLFCDFHAKSLSPQKDGYDITQYAQDNIWLTHAGKDGSSIPSVNSNNCD